MIKRLFILFMALSTWAVSAQDNTSSPYSYFGIGLPSFNGSADFRSMQGLSIEADSTRYNLQNPASLGKLQLTNYAVGVTQGFTNLRNAEDKESVRNTSFDYIAVAFPMGKFSIGAGIIPQTSVGYRIKESTDNGTSRFEGSGGLNRVFLSAGYQISNEFRVGLEGDYNFGSLRNTTSLYQNDIQYGSLEKNRSNLSGVNFKVATQYDIKLPNKLNLTTSASYSFKQKLSSDNTRQLATIIRSGDGDQIVNENEISISDANFYTPSELRVGAGIGKTHKWFVGAEYQHLGKADYTNTSLALNNVTYKETKAYRLGGYYIPNYSDITNYFKRITLRAGLRYQEMGMAINDQDIDEFGISFGVGLPAGRYLSNINIGAEYGQRGTTTAGLIKEDFVNIFIGISFNDRWFVQRRYR